MFIDYEIAGNARSAEVRVEPAREIQIFISPYSHHDLGYTDVQSNIDPAGERALDDERVGYLRLGIDAIILQEGRDHLRERTFCNSVIGIRTRDPIRRTAICLLASR